MPAWLLHIIGAVDYKYQKELSEWIASVSPVDYSDLTKVMVESLFLKRRNFSHEKEIRVIYQPDETSPDCSQNLKIYSIDLTDFLEEITFDPRADNDFMRNAHAMIGAYNFPMNRVNKSSLYDFKQEKIDLK